MTHPSNRFQAYIMSTEGCCRRGQVACNGRTDSPAAKRALNGVGGWDGWGRLAHRPHSVSVCSRYLVTSRQTALTATGRLRSSCDIVRKSRTHVIRSSLPTSPPGGGALCVTAGGHGETIVRISFSQVTLAVRVGRKQIGESAFCR